MDKVEPNQEILIDFWKNIFGTKSKTVSRSFKPDKVIWETFSLITIKEVVKTVKSTKDGAAGPDGWTLSDLKALESKEIALHLNLNLLTLNCLTRFTKTSTTLIPKKLDFKDPGNFRLITVTDFIVRIFRKILEVRSDKHLSIGPRQ